MNSHPNQLAWFSGNTQVVNSLLQLLRAKKKMVSLKEEVLQTPAEVRDQEEK